MRSVIPKPLTIRDKLVRSVYRFHVYFQTRRILEEMKAAFPNDDSFSRYSNAYDARAYKRICSDFGLSPRADMWQRVDHGCQGLGSWSTFWKPPMSYRHAHTSQGTFFHPMDAIRHNVDISHAWSTFVLDKSEGLSRAGVERLNDSIRTYMWAVLGAQGQTRANILTPGMGFDNQRQLISNVEDAVNSPVDLPGSIDRYQKALM